MRAYYSTAVHDFLREDTTSILGKLDIQSTEFHSLRSTQQFSWLNFIDYLKTSLSGEKKSLFLGGHILFEYRIPRRSKRIDCVLLFKDVIIVIEFKDGAESYDAQFDQQVEDYCLDLRDFHKESRGRSIVPIVLAPLAPDTNNAALIDFDDPVKAVIHSNKSSLAKLIGDSILKHSTGRSDISPKAWENSEYLPTPTIIEAAQSFFAGQGVEEITRSHADSTNLSNTTKEIVRSIELARSQRKKLICFVTGVPGAGKTLVGLNIVHEPGLYSNQKSLAAYFSGNGPLVKVLREAITRDRFENQVSQFKTKKQEISRKVNTQIQNLHAFIEHHIATGQVPAEHIAIFDEAQRCWDGEHLFRKNKQNANRKESPILSPQSEPELLLEIMDRREDWAVMIALVGNGQEINSGEAGIGEWGRALCSRFVHWEVLISPELLKGDVSLSRNKLFTEIPSSMKVTQSESLHLKVSQRSYKAKALNTWVELILNGEPREASMVYEEIRKEYPIYLTRELYSAKQFLKSKARGSRRIGLVASSGAKRIQPDGVTLLQMGDEANWFLNDQNDIRSSYYLELAATEFGIQGLEIDWAGLCWEGDLRLSLDTWEYHKFSGSRWRKVRQEVDQLYLINKYRVLLTRAREGMVIWVPKGSCEDQTRLPEFYDCTHEYLTSCGLINLPS